MIAWIMNWLKEFARTLNEYFCVYITQEGKTKAIKVTEKECEEEI